MQNAFAHRELYCPAHFGNSYEAMWQREMREVLAEARHWGFTHYGDWFDNAELKNPRKLTSHDRYSFSPLLRRRKIEHFQSAASLGFGLDLVLTPNHAYVDQQRDDLLAEADDEKMFGQLLCPSIPEARDIIIRNHKELLEDLAEAGVEVSSLSACPYDFGGCSCDRCSPWILAFGKLFVDIHAAAREIFPEIEARLIGWWWEPEEHRLFNEWADREHPGLFRSLAGYIPYDDLAPGESATNPGGCESHAFIHIGYADARVPHDLYGGWGPTIAPSRIAETLRALSGRKYSGFMAYSEGVFDDANKALLGGMSSGAYAASDDVLRAYAERYFGAAGPEAEAWAEWLSGWGEPFDRDIVAARARFDSLSKPAGGSWRLDQLESKLRLFEAHRAVLDGDAWNETRLGAAETFFAEREHLNREVWGLGITRHILDPEWNTNCPSWYGEWRGASGVRGTSEGGSIDEA